MSGTRKARLRGVALALCAALGGIYAIDGRADRAILASEARDL
jgi:hypothetical protein